jgi:hypothetical protein
MQRSVWLPMHSWNGPGFDPSILKHSGIWGAADEAVLNIVRKKIKKYKKKNVESVRWRPQRRKLTTCENGQKQFRVSYGIWQLLKNTVDGNRQAITLWHERLTTTRIKLRIQIQPDPEHYIKGTVAPD